MAQIKYTSSDGSVHMLPLAEGQDPAAVVKQFEEAQFQQTLSSVPELPDPNATLSSEVGVGEPLIGTNNPATAQERIERGTALGLRSVAGAIPKTATGIADLGATVLNFIPELISRGDQFLGGKPLNARLPTDSTASFDEFLNEIFPEPQTLPERIVVGTGEVALAGGAGTAALVPKAGRATQLATPSRATVSSNLAEDIGSSVLRNPKQSAAAELLGGGGAVTGGELAGEADLPPGQRMIATILGGLLGGAFPAAGINLLRRGGRAIAENLAPATKPGSELRAARRLQEEASDIPAAERAVKDAPEGVTPARATEDPNLMAMERRVLEDDPKLGRQVETERLAAEDRTLTELADQFGPTSDKAAWQQEVVLQGAPDSAPIKAGQPDEMLNEAAKAFKPAYKAAEGYPIQSQKVQVEGGNVPLKESLDAAAANPRVLADERWRTGVQKFVENLYDDMVARGERVGGPDDAPLYQFDSADLLEMRSVLRDEIRRKTKTGRTNPRADAEAKLLQGAERELTAALESQLPAEASQALRATDARYANLKTVEDAILRSGEKGLTPEALRAATKARAESASQYARGRTGELGKLAETGKDVRTLLGKPEQLQRAVRNMSPEQAQAAKADLNDAISTKATLKVDGESRINGAKYVDEVTKNRESLEAAGFSKQEISNMQRIGRELRMVQARPPAAVTKLLEDNVSTVLRLLGAVAGSRAGTHLLRITGGATGAGPSLILAQFGSRRMQNALTSLSVDQADALIRRAMTDRELFEALLVKPTATLPTQARAARTIEAFLTEPAKQVSGEDE